MGTGDLSGFRSAGRALFSLGLVKGSEGNLSTFDGEHLLITRSGCSLGDLGDDDVLAGALDELPVRASSDAALHVTMYRERGPGAIAHAHPSGTVPEDWVEGEPHGRYAHAATLERAVEVIVAAVREGR